jgi:hypothetical protein
MRCNNNYCFGGIDRKGGIYFPSDKTKIEFPEKSHTQQSLNNKLRFAFDFKHKKFGKSDENVQFYISLHSNDKTTQWLITEAFI